MSNMTEVKKFDDFRRLYNSVATLLKSQSYFKNEGKEATERLWDLARKMEISAHVQKNDFIAVAGMQGTGKTTLIKNLYEIPDNILRICSGRGERIPVFITEDPTLGDGEYKARATQICDSGKIEKIEISAEETAQKSSVGANYAYIELFVSPKCNVSWVLLPGFEKESRDSFNDSYNSLMEYTLHFAKAVLLVTDDSGIANRDIHTLMQILGQSFSSQNCIFAITKCDGLDEDDCLDLAENLHDICNEDGICVGLDRIVCTGEHDDEEQNDLWREKLCDALDGVFDVDASKKSYLYYKPMVREMLECADSLERTLNIEKLEEKHVSPIHALLEESLENEMAELARELEMARAKATKDVIKNFGKVYDSIPGKYKKDKKLIFHKKASRIASDREYIAERCNTCLLADNGKSLLTEKLSESYLTEEKKAYLASSHARLLTGMVKSDDEGNTGNDDAQNKENNLKIVGNEAITYFFDPTKKEMVLPKGVSADLNGMSDLIATEFKSYFIGMINGEFDPSSVSLNTSSISDAVFTAEQARKKKNHATIPAAATFVDLLDGKADVLTGVVSTVLVGASEAVVSTVCAYVAIAVIVGVAACGGVNIYNAHIKEYNAIAEAWKRSLLNALEQQKNDYLDAYELGMKNLLKYVDQVHREKMYVGDRQKRIIDASYAIAEVRHLADIMNDKYADTLTEAYGESK